MSCAKCGRANRAGARFCGSCGTALASRCPACGAESEPDAQFCDACGASLVAGSSEEAVARKVVTILFADLIGSTSLHERLDAESVRRLMDRYYRALQSVVEAHGGTVVKLLGDGVMAAFGVPRVAEDDAIRAVRAAVEMVQVVKLLVVRLLGEDNLTTNNLTTNNLSIRVAVNTGEVVVSADRHDIVGDPVNVAARLQQEARDGEVLIGEATRRLVSELVTLAALGALSLKGRSESVGAYRVVSLNRPTGARATPFVGRDDELRRITAIYDEAVATRRARLAVILGSPGLGKSRLAAEFARRLGAGATVLTARCDAAGGGTFAPLAAAVRNFLCIDDGTGSDGLRTAIEAALPPGEVERVRIAAGVAGLLTGAPVAPEETFFVIRRFLAALGAAQPVVLVIDDLHWAEPLLLDLTEHLVQWGAGVPLLVLAAARPELRDTRASLTVRGSLVHDVLTLTGLDAGAATRLAAGVVGASELPAAVAGRLLATSEGNPLFLGELVRMLVEDGALRREGDRWVAAVDLAEIEVPPTIHALLAARIERLRVEDRTVVERAAVIGRQFSRASVAQLLPAEVRAGLDARLEALRRSELIEADTGWFLGEPALRFHHALIRDAAYRRLLKGTRAELHSRFAGWIETRANETSEHDETIGWHLEQAHQHLRELGPLDEAGRTLGERAARYLAAAGRRALARDDVSLAASLLGRALNRLDRDDAARADLALDWCEALLAAGDVGHAGAAIDELDRLIRRAPFEPPPEEGGSSGRAEHSFSINESTARAEEAASSQQPPSRSPDRLRAWHTCFVGQLALLTDPQALRATADAVAAAAERFIALGDAAGEAKAHSVHALALSRLGNVGACESVLDRALAAARRANDRRRANAILAGAPLAALWGPSPVTRASGRCLDVVRVLRMTEAAPAVEAVALRCQAVLEALRGRIEAARRMIASTRQMVEELGIMPQLLETGMCAGHIELLEGDAVAAERSLRAAYDGLRTHGLGIDAARAAALLGRALLGQGRAAEAEALSHESERLAGDDLKAAIAWRGLRAEALAQRGEHAAAVDLARAAADIASATDALLDHADARVALAVALRAAGRSSDADTEEARAIELWEVKGATLLAERGRRDAGGVAQADRAPDDRDEEALACVDEAVAGFDELRAAQVDAALDRSEELSAELLVSRIENAATRSADRFDDAWEARDWERLAALFPPRFRNIDRRPMIHLEIDRDRWLDSLRHFFGWTTHRLRHEILATRGDRLALFRYCFAGTDRSVGPSEIEWLEVSEVDDRGDPVATIAFDPDHLDAAYADLEERYAAKAADSRRAALTRAFTRAFAARDWHALSTLLAPDLVVNDHRLLGWETLHGPAEYIQALKQLVDLAPDVQLRVDHLTMSDPRFLYVTTWVGTREGGAFETPGVIICELDAMGRICRFDQYDIDRLEEVKMRFEAGAENAETPLATSPKDAQRGMGSRVRQLASHETLAALIKPNAACRVRDHMLKISGTRDWQTLRSLVRSDFRFEDRRKLVRLAGNVDLLTQHAESVLWARVQHVRELICTAGDRVALERVLWVEEPGRGAFEIEFIRLVEIDADGLAAAWIYFDADDRWTAFDEAHARFIAGEAAAIGGQAPIIAATRTFARRDWEALRGYLAHDAVIWDHCTLGMGSLGRDEWIDSLRVWVDRAPDLDVEQSRILTWNRHGRVALTRVFGTMRDGGRLEKVFVDVFLTNGDRIQRHEFFDVGDADEALARFTELCAERR